VSIGTQQTLQRYARPLFVSSATSDKDVPFSFRDWYAAYQGIIPGQEYKQYNEYLTNWYKEKALQVTNPKIQLRLNYLTLLKQLQLFFTKEEAENWYNKVDITNDKELLLAIPYFARKLKDIALYYLQLRDNIKESRLKYNQVGTGSGIIQQIQKFLLLNYTQKPDSSISLPSSIWREVPELSSVKDSITVQIEELYDTKHYFDQSPTMPVSAYYDVNNAELQNFLTTKGLTLTSTEWIYKLGVHPLSASYTELSGGDLTDLSLQIAEKYLSQDKYLSTSPSFSARTDFYEVALSPGNNFLYWPIGAYQSKAKTNPRYESVFINESGLSTGATAGSSLEVADTVFIKTTRGVEGAWFRNHLYDYKTENMYAELAANTKTTFRFPFPGYGLSASDIEWTGFDLTYNPQFFFLESSIQQSVENAYWSTAIDLTSNKPVALNDTTLVENRAYPNLDYNRADKIKLWSAPPSYTETVYSGETKEAWLYRYNQTDISIALSGNSVIVWPYESIDPNNDFPSYYPENIAEVCQPLPVSAVNFSRAIAGNALSGADIIYKLSNYKDTPDLAIECCWLSGAPNGYPETKIVNTIQGELQFVAAPGLYTRFVWDGPDFTDANTIFKTLRHQPDCKFANTNNTTYLDSNLCTCKQVLFTPFGHPGQSYSDNNGFADFIIENNFDPQTLDLSNWRDSSGTAYIQSSAFGWYRTNTNIGWGDGQWYTGSLSAGNNFYLQNGKAYVYYRANVTKQDKEEINLPEYVLRYPYNKISQSWIKAFKNENNEWVSSNQPTGMILYPGDILLYQRAQSTSYNLTGAILETIDISENRGSVWSDFDYISIDPTKQVVLNYPYQTNSPLSAYGQYPAVSLNNILRIAGWTLTPPTGPAQTYLNTSSLLFTPTLTGVYTASVTAVSATSLGLGTYTSTTSGFYIFTNIPPITAISDKALVPTLTSYSTPVPGYVLNTPLRGWDYNLGRVNNFALPSNTGAKPYWAKTYLDRNEFTGYKGINSWGTPQRFLDKYNIITQPEISDIVLETGNKIEYTRNNPVNLFWTQPVDLTVTVDKNEWCTLNVVTTGESNLEYQLNNFKNDLVVYPTSATSYLQFESFIDNEPTEVYYNAINAFTWNITANPEIPETVYQTPSALLTLETVQPWANLPNKNYPTVAAFPSFEELYSITDTGGFFVPSNIGASVYVEQDYTATLDPSSTALKSYFENIKQTYNNRGLTKQDQTIPYTNYTENNIWLKEPLFTGPIAGTNKKSVFKKYQKFLPYQSGYESNPRLKIGLLNPQSRQTPWGGKEDSEWTDLQNKPTSFAGELDVNTWADSQVLKQTGLQIDNWNTDIFGNQYGLYKNLEGVLPYNRKFVTGEIWVRKNSQFVEPAYQSLKNIFDTYTGTNLINELTGTGIRKTDVFFDTLLVETSGTVIFERINYDYNTDNIFSVADEARYLSLAMPVSTNLDKEFANQNLSQFTFAKAGDTWFFPEEKLVAQSVCGLQNSILTPEIYQLDINNQNLKKIFPVIADDILSITSLSSLGLIYIDPPTLSHNSLKREYLLTIFGKNSSNRNIIIEISISDLTTKTIKNITVYNPVENTVPVNPPFISQILRTDVSITNLEFENALNFQVVAENGPVVFEKVSGPSWINLSPTGLFTGTPPFATTLYNTIFKATNSVGPTFYSFITNVTYTEILTIYYMYTEGYELSGSDGFVLQEDDGQIIVGVE
jgi:hypothetical protein